MKSQPWDDPPKKPEKKTSKSPQILELPQNIDNLQTSLVTTVEPNFHPIFPEKWSIDQIRQQKEIAVANFQLYQHIMNDIVNDDDYAIVGGKKFLRKTGFKKLALAFNISDPDIEIVWYDDEEVHVKATAVAPNGRTTVDYAICTMGEVFGTKSKHNLLTKAITRAKSRAISNLIGCGLVSYEEVE